MPLEEAVALAAHAGNTEAVMKWLREGAEINAVGPGGDTLLIAASVGGQVRLVRRLLNLSANVNQRNDSGLTALMGAVSQPGAISSLLAKVL